MEICVYFQGKQYLVNADLLETTPLKLKQLGKNFCRVLG